MNNCSVCSVTNTTNITLSKLCNESIIQNNIPLNNLPKFLKNNRTQYENRVLQIHNDLNCIHTYDDYNILSLLINNENNIYADILEHLKDHRFENTKVWIKFYTYRNTRFIKRNNVKFVNPNHSNIYSNDIWMKCTLYYFNHYKRDFLDIDEILNATYEIIDSSGNSYITTK